MNLLAIVIGVLLLGGFINLDFVVAQDFGHESPSNTQSIIQSRFILWDPAEKMIDSSFNITLISWANYTHNYTIMLDNEKYSGRFYQYAIINFTYNNSYIGRISVMIDNNYTLIGDNIIVMKGVTSGRIRHYIDTYKIEFLPFELSEFKWNLFWANIIAFFICIPTAYFTVKYYRKNIGARRV